MPTDLIVLTTSATSAAVPTSDRAAGGMQAFFRATRLISIALVAVSAVVAFAPHNRADRAEAATTTPPVSAPAAAPTTLAPAVAVPEITDGAGLVAAINAARSAKGLAVLQSDPVLDSGAQQWADAMATQGSVSHDPQLTAAYSDDWKRMGENVSTGMSIGELHADSLRTAAATILDPTATLVGVGIALKPGGGVFLVERTVG